MVFFVVPLLVYTVKAFYAVSFLSVIVVETMNECNYHPIQYIEPNESAQPAQLN